MGSKKDLRIEARRILKSFDSDRREYAALHASECLFATSCWRRAGRIISYMSMALELDTRNVFLQAWKEGKETYIPRIVGHELEFRRIESFEEPLNKGAYGISEPRPNSAPWIYLDKPEEALLLIPGMAFDREGRRLGRGGGFYDGFLSRMRSEVREAGMKLPLCFGFVYDEQVFPAIPTEKHDQGVDGIISDSRIVFTVLQS